MSASAPQMAPIADEPDSDVPERRCIATGAVQPKEGLIRFVVRPGVGSAPGELVPDLEERLPGRGLWITARRDIVAGAVAKNLFAKAARASVVVAPDLVERLAALLTQRCIDRLGLARRAGQAVAGFEQVRAWIERGRAAVLVEASDGSEEGRRKLRGAGVRIPTVLTLSARELGAAFGRDHVGHVALARGRIAEGFCREAGRLAGFRPAANEIGNEQLLTTDR